MSITAAASTFLTSIGPGGQLMLLLSVGVPLLLVAVYLTGRTRLESDGSTSESRDGAIAAEH